MATVTITCNLPSLVTKMTPVTKENSWFNIDAIQRENHPMLPKNIKWENITKSNVIVCVRPDNKLNYCFPILESENRENDYYRVKVGVKYFHNEKYLIYLI